MRKTIAIIGLLGPACIPRSGPAGASASDNSLLHVQADRIVDGRGNPVVLRGVAFGNRVWGHDRIPREHHAELDYQRVSAMGMNSVRFYLNYQTFESDAAPGTYLADGFQWLDDNIAWAKRYGIKLVLNMHVPPGGFQSLGKGGALWDDPKMQERLIALWTAIAKRYSHEATIAGYDLLNEPVVTRSPAQWHELAARVVKAIRQVDGQHIIFIERVNGVGTDWKEDENKNFFRVDDANVVYEFHFYKPFELTHMNAPWVEHIGASGRYPDDSRVAVEWFNQTWKTGSFDSPKLPPGDSDWAFYQGQPITVTDAALVIGKPALVCKNNPGKAWFDDLLLEELGAGQPREMLRTNITRRREFYFWSSDNTGRAEDESIGHGDGASASISGTRSDANLGSDALRFRTAPGKTYRLSGWMKGERIGAETTCQIRLDLYSSKVPVLGWNSAFLEREIDGYLAWGKRENVPLFLGEVGTIRESFEQGGLRWASDVIDVLLERKVNFCWHAYHEDFFALYYGDGSLPEPGNANAPLIKLFTDKLAGR